MRRPAPEPRKLRPGRLRALALSRKMPRWSARRRARRSQDARAPSHGVRPADRKVGQRTPRKRPAPPGAPSPHGGTEKGTGAPGAGIKIREAKRWLNRSRQALFPSHTCGRGHFHRATRLVLRTLDNRYHFAPVWGVSQECPFSTGVASSYPRSIVNKRGRACCAGFTP
jgi:hypothetical protein